MNILMLADVFYPDTVGGAGRVVYHLCLELSRMGHEVHIITRNIAGQLPSHQQLSPNLFIHRFLVPSNESLWFLVSEIRNSFLSAREIAKKMSFDILCAHQSMVSIGPLLSGHLNNIPIIYYYHSPWHEEFMTKKRTGKKKFGVLDRIVSYKMRFMEKYILHKASKCVALSRYMSNRLSEIHNIPPGKIVEIPGGVDLDLFRLPDKNRDTCKHALNLDAVRTVFLTIRNLVPRMGLENLIEAFCRSRILKKKAVLLIGGRGFLERHLKKMVNDLDLKNTVRFLGHIPDEDLPKYYQASDYSVLPTEELEGFGLVILESLACGTPVLGTPVGAIPEIIERFDKRFLFKGTSWKDIKEKMEAVIGEPDNYHFDPKAYRSFIEDNYSWKKVADYFEKVAMGLIRH